MSFEQTTNQLKTTINNKQDTVSYKHNRILLYNTVLGTKEIIGHHKTSHHSINNKNNIDYLLTRLDYKLIYFILFRIVNQIERETYRIDMWTAAA